MDMYEFGSSQREELIKLARGAKNPFQFISHIMLLCLWCGNKYQYYNLPLSRDASSSAYQRMSYFLLNKTLGYSTNLWHIEGEDRIRDIYQDFLDEAEPFLRASLGDELYDIVAPNLTRKLINKLYMPIVYGKSLFSSITYV